MGKLSDMLSRSKLNQAEAKKKQQAAVSAPSVSAKRSILHGTGITKRTAEQAEREQQAAQQRTWADTQEDIREDIKHAEEVLKREEGEEYEHIHFSDARKMPQDSPDWEWDESQLEAIEGIIRNQYSVLIGAAGTGKTTTTNEVLRRLPEGAKVYFCAFTGRAVQQMRRAIPEHWHKYAMTIHKLLEYAPEFYEDFDDEGRIVNKRRFIPFKTASNPIQADVIVIDEGGMCPAKLWNELWDAILPNTKIIIIGDINQLPPVQGKSVLGFAMQKWPTYELTKIHRQAAGNPIIANAHRILNGQFPAPDPQKFAMIEIKGGSQQAAGAVNGIMQKLKAAKMFDPFADALIVPQNKSHIGQLELNVYLRQLFNPEIEKDGIKLNRRLIVKTGVGTAFYAVGDKVMLLENINERGLTNGMTAVIRGLEVNPDFKGFHEVEKHSNLEIDFSDLASALEAVHEEEDKISREEANQRQASHIMEVEFANEQIVQFKTAGDYRAIAHAYAITCHKSQGGEYPTVVILVHSANNVMLSREWLYTAVTRAREKVLLIYNERGLAQACNRQHIKGRTLEDKIKSFVANESVDYIVAELPEPREMGL